MGPSKTRERVAYVVAATASSVAGAGAGWMLRECRLGPAQLEDATGWIDAYRRAWEHRLDRFGAYVEERR